jgi:hypothetical protein
MEAWNTRVGQVEDELRGALRQAGLDWLLEEVDRTIAEGRPVVRGRRGEHRPFTLEFDARDGEVTAEEFTPSERIQLILDAVRRTLADAPALAEEAAQLLSVPNADPSVTFVDPASNEERRSFPSRAQRERARDSAVRLEEILTEIEREVG